MGFALTISELFYTFNPIMESAITTQLFFTEHGVNVVVICLSPFALDNLF
jgi:hypothetical protein